MAHAVDEPNNVRYRRLAQRYLDIAPTILHAPARESVLEMAKNWLRLAQECEDQSGAQSVGQQQQQIQPQKPEGDGGFRS